MFDITYCLKWKNNCTYLLVLGVNYFTQLLRSQSKNFEKNPSSSRVYVYLFDYKITIKKYTFPY